MAKVPRFQRRSTTPAYQPAPLFMPHLFTNTIQFIDAHPPMVYMTRDAFSRMWHFVDIADEEVGWLGTVKKTPYGNFLIEEVFLLDQEVSASQTEISEEGIAQLAEELITTRADGVDVANRIRFWGHSHVRMDTFPSGQDEAQMRHFEQNECPWFIRGILNKLGRMQFDIFLWEVGVKITDASWAIYDEHFDQRSRAQIEAEFKAKVTRRPYTPQKYVYAQGARQSLARSSCDAGEDTVTDPVTAVVGDADNVG